MSGSDAVYVGVLRVRLQVSEARTKKDRRQVVRSLKDRVRQHFAVTCAELGDDPHPGRQLLVMTTAGNDAGTIRSILDRILTMFQGSGTAWPVEVDADVFRWHPPERVGGPFGVTEEDTRD